MRHRINFKDKVYRVVKKIPRGKVLTYKKVAKLVNRPRAWRAVGNILSKSSGIPCHRVTRSESGNKEKNCPIKKRRANH
jgi:O-6-methylguanine DNA methyltransferase